MVSLEHVPTKTEPKIRWFDFTLHTYDEESLCEDHGSRLQKLLNDIASAAVFSLELGAEKQQYHFQGRMRVIGTGDKGRKTLQQVIDAFRNPAYDLINCVDSDMNAYNTGFSCRVSITSKECIGKWAYVTKTDTHIAGPWYVKITEQEVCQSLNEADDFEFPDEVVNEYQQDEVDHQYIWKFPRRFQREILESVTNSNVRQINIIRDDGKDGRGRTNPTYPKGGHAGKSEWAILLADRFYTGFPDGVPKKDDIDGLKQVQPVVIYMDGLQSQKLMWEKTWYELQVRRVKKRQPRITIILDCTRNVEAGGWNNEWKAVLSFAESIRNGRFREPRNNWKEFRTAKVRVWILGNDLPPVNLSEGKCKEWALKETTRDADDALDYKLDPLCRGAPQ